MEEVPVAEDRNVWSLSEQEIGFVNYQQLLHMMSVQGLNRRQVEDIKALRRKVRNRKCARECSTRKRRQAKNMVVVNAEMQGEMEEMSRMIHTLRQENFVLRAQNAGLQRASLEYKQEVQGLRTQVQAFADLFSRLRVREGRE